MSKELSVEKLISYIATSLVDMPDAVSLESESSSEKELVFRLRVAPKDLGKIIGKKGRTIRAMRVLASAFGAQQDKRILLEVIEPEEY